MRSILIIAKWEVNRLLGRFGGRSGIVILGVVLLAVAASFLVYHSGVIGGKELYRIGVSPGAPRIYDQRFSMVDVDEQQGADMLRSGDIDVFVDTRIVLYRDDDRSVFVKDAVLTYLAEQELFGIADEYGLDRAFPLRIELTMLERQESGTPLSPGGSPQTSGGTAATGDSAVAVVPVDEREKGEGQPELESIAGSPSEVTIERDLQSLKDILLTDEDVIIPSLSPPVLPMAQVLLVFAFVLPVLFVAVFFASSFAEERISRRLVVLLSTPVTPLQVILGKMFPYLIYSWLVIIILSIAVKAGIPINLAIYTPVILFVFSTYMIVALMYRSFKDLTLFSVVVISGIMVYLVVPALLTGVTTLSYISPLTLAVEAYRGETFGVAEYFLATVPLYVIFVQALYVGTRVFNEEYLTGYRPLHVKIADAMKLAVNRAHLSLSAFLSPFFFIPFVFIVQLVLIIFARNIPLPASLWLLVVSAAFTEELVKSVVPYIVVREKLPVSFVGILKLSALAGFGFFVGEKLLLLLALSVLPETSYLTAAFTGGLWIFPLLLHVFCTGTVGVLTWRFGHRFYLPAVIIGAILHAVYNLFVAGVFA